MSDFEMFERNVEETSKVKKQYSRASTKIIRMGTYQDDESLANDLASRRQTEQNRINEPVSVEQEAPAQLLQEPSSDPVV